MELTLFEGIPFQTFAAPERLSKAERISAMENARKAEKNSECVKAFKPFLIEYNASNSLFIIADVIEAYKAKRLPLPAVDFRCIGGIVNSLAKGNILVWTGAKRELNDGTGRAMKVYRGKI